MRILHALLSVNLLPDPSSGGRLRSKQIGIGQSIYEPLQVPRQIEIYFGLPNSPSGRISGNKYAQTRVI